MLVDYSQAGFIESKVRKNFIFQSTEHMAQVLHFQPGINCKKQDHWEHFRIRLKPRDCRRVPNFKRISAPRGLRFHFLENQ